MILIFLLTSQYSQILLTSQYYTKWVQKEKEFTIIKYV